MSKYERFRQECGRKEPLKGLLVRQAVPTDVSGIAAVSAERYGKPIAQFEEKIHGELQAAAEGSSVLFVAIAEGVVVGFARCRYMDTAAAPVKFPSPSGWYGLGIIVQKLYRGRGVARALSDFRAAWLRDEAGADRLYSFVSAENPVSQKMHADFGFQAVAEGAGFLNVSFDCGRGILYSLELKQGKGP